MTGFAFPEILAAMNDAAQAALLTSLTLLTLLTLLIAAMNDAAQAADTVAVRGALRTH